MVLDWRGNAKVKKGAVPKFKGTIEQAIDSACRETKNKKANLIATRMKREFDQVTFRDWDDMHDWIAGLAPEGIGEATIFKIATTIGEVVGLPRTSIYLRGDVRTVWNKLHGTRRVPEIDGRVPETMLPPDLLGMRAPEIEAMLLMNRDALQPWLKASPPPAPSWIEVARKTLDAKELERFEKALLIVAERPVTQELAALDPKTEKLVDEFAEALKTKLLAAQIRYGYYDGWADSTWREDCVKKLRDHIKKGDPRDVAAYCAFMWFHGWSTS